MAIRRSATCGLRHEIPHGMDAKYRKWVKREDIRRRVREIFSEIGAHHGFEIQEMRVAPDHVHIFWVFAEYSIAHVVGMLKSISRVRFLMSFPKLKKELWGGEFWEDGYLRGRLETR